MKYMDELKDMLCKEVDEIAEKGDLSAGDLETLHKLTDTIKNIDKIEMYEDNEYSNDGTWNAAGSYGRNGRYDNGDSYARRHYVKGHYSRDTYPMNDNYSMGRYSREDGKNYMMNRIGNLMGEASTPKEREVLERCMRQLENA